MNIIKKVAFGAAILCAATVANAESLVFGAYVEPIMTLEVEGRILPAEALLSGASSSSGAAETDPTVGAFKVTTNMAKWNLKILSQNNGVLKGRFSESLLTTDVATGGELGTTDEEIFLCPTLFNGDAVAAACKVTETGDSHGMTDGAAVSAAADITGAAVKLSEAAKLSDLSGTTVEDFYNSQKVSIAVEIRTHIDGEVITALAGTYTETLYISAYGSY